MHIVLLHDATSFDFLSLGPFDSVYLLSILLVDYVQGSDGKAAYRSTLCIHSGRPHPKAQLHSTNLGSLMLAVMAVISLILCFGFAPACRCNEQCIHVPVLS